MHGPGPAPPPRRGTCRWNFQQLCRFLLNTQSSPLPVTVRKTLFGHQNHCFLCAQSVAFIDKSSATLNATAAIPLEGLLEVGLLQLRPRHFGGGGGGGFEGVNANPSSSSHSSSPPSSPASMSSSSSLSFRSDLREDSGGRDAEGGDDIRGGKRPAGAAGKKVDGRDARGKTNERAAGAAAPGDTTGSLPAPHAENPVGAAEASEARQDVDGNNGVPASGSRARGRDGRDHAAAIPTSNTGWVRGEESHHSRSSGGRRASPSSPIVSGCWVPPPTRWGGTPIKSLPWGDRGEGAEAYAEKSRAGTGDGRRSSSRSRSFPFGDKDGDCRGGRGGGSDAPCHEWEEAEGDWHAYGRESFRVTDEFFRTVDGRSLFAESLGSLSGTKRALPEIRWEEERQSGQREGGRRRGFLCLLGEEECRASDRGSPDSRRLGVAARRRRVRIDSRSRDGKRRAEMLTARARIRRLEDEVFVKSRRRVLQCHTCIYALPHRDRGPDQKYSACLALA